MKEKTLEFKDIESQLKEQFDLLMANPEKFDIKGKEAEEIKKLNKYAKKAGYKLFIEEFKANLIQETGKELALTIEEDLKEDHVEIHTLEMLDEMLKHPEEKKFHLELQMIDSEHIIEWDCSI